MAIEARIIHVLPQDGIGGVEVAARAMLSEDQRRCNFKLLLIAGRALSSSPMIIESGHSGLNNLRAHWVAARIIMKLQPDVLICSLWRSVPACILAKIVCPRLALVMFLHLDRPMHLVDRILTRLGIMTADEVWSDSAVTLAARKIPSNKARKIVSFVTDRLLPARTDAVLVPRFVCWARIVPQKGFDRAIAFIKSLVDRGVDAHLDIWGPDGGEQPTLERQVADLDLGPHVAFRGAATRDMLPAIAASNSFFLQLSRFEGMAMSVVEGMQLGLVPVTTGAGQMVHYVQNGVTGLRVDADRLSEAADTLAALLDCPSRFAAMRANSLAYWMEAPLYADDVCAYACELAKRHSISR